MRFSGFTLFFFLFLYACGSVSTGPGPTVDGGADVVTADVVPDTSDAAPAPRYPAFTPEMTQMVNHKGGVLSAPKIVTVTWSTDANQAYYNTFGDSIGASDYWKATTSEYGVGPAVSGGHVSITTPPPSTMTDSALDTYIGTQVAGAPSNGWPVNDSQTLYVVYLPDTLKLTIGGNTECNAGVGGYHTETMAGGGGQVVYATIGLECHTNWMEGLTQFATHVASHEMVEAVTDPHVQTSLGWVGFDAPHWAWAELNNYANENGDMCEFFPDRNYLSTAPPNWLQRTWSNVAAKAGHNPCEPYTDPYFNVTPLGLQDITIKDRGQKIQTKGYALPLGVESSIDLGFYSDAPTPAWPIEVVEGNPLFGKPPPSLTIATTTNSGKDGDVVSVYITPKVASAANGTLVTVISTGAGTHYMPFLVMAQ